VTLSHPKLKKYIYISYSSEFLLSSDIKPSQSLVFIKLYSSHIHTHCTLDESKASWASSWVNSWLLPLSQNESLCSSKLFVWKCMSPVRSFSGKSSHFHEKCFARAFVLKKRQTATPKWKQSLHMSQVAHQAGAYPGFYSMKRLGVFLLPLDGMLVHRKVTLQY